MFEAIWRLSSERRRSWSFEGWPQDFRGGSGKDLGCINEKPPNTVVDHPPLDEISQFVHTRL